MRYLLILLMLSACGTIEHQSRLQQEPDTRLLAGPGDVVLRVEKTRNLENAFGRADIFGRKTREGYSELHYAGMENDGTLVFYRSDLSVETNETTLSRSAFITSYGSSDTVFRANATDTALGTQVAGSANSDSFRTTMVPTEDYHMILPSGAVPVRLPPGTTWFVSEGHKIELLSISPGAIEYRIVSPN